MIQRLDFDSDQRGVSEVLGAILVFGILIVLLSIIQTQAVPAQNQEIEFKHNQEVQGDFAELQQSVSKSVRDGNRRSVSFSLGASYPSRLLFINPPDPSGTIRSTEPRSAVIDNIDSGNTDVGEWIQSGNSGELRFELRSLVYESNYNEYQNPPSVVSEYGVMYLNASDSSIVVEDRAVVDGTTISLVSTAGDFDRSSAATRPLGVDAAPAPTTTVPIQHDSPGPNNFIELTLPTRLGQEQWDNIVSGQSNVDSANVDATANEVTLELKSEDSGGNQIEYELEVPRYEVDNSAPSPSPTYVATDAGSSKRVPPGEDVEVTAEVRDEYNNPIPGELVGFELRDTTGALVDQTDIRADEQGQATAEFSANDFKDGYVIEVNASSITSSSLGETQTTLQVGDPAGPVVVTATSIDRGNDEITLTLLNDGTVDVGIDEIQLESAVQSLPSGIDLDPTTDNTCSSGTTLDCPTVEKGPEQVTFVNDFGGSRVEVNANDGEGPETVRTGDTLAAGTSADLTLEFDSINDDDAAVMIRVKVFFFQGNVEAYDVAFAKDGL